MNKCKKLKTKILGIGLLLVAPFSVLGGTMLANDFGAGADSAYLTEWVDPNCGASLLTNKSFTISGIYQDTPLSGWTLIDGATASSKGMIIDVGGNSFSSNKNNYYLNNNPGKMKNTNASKSTDNKILMINSRNSLTEDVWKQLPPAKRGYRSNEFTLEANSFYRISVDAKTSLDGRTDVDGAYASIYLSGLKDADGKDVKMAFEGVSGQWKTYYLFVATGAQAQKVTLDLYLGRTSSEASFGAAFFDEVNIEQYSENAFMSTITNETFNYQSVDTNLSSDGTVKFLVNGLKSDSYPLMNRDDYKNANFDFEKPFGANGLSENWETSSISADAHARIYNIVDNKAIFENTGYSFVGSDLGYKNKQALALYTTKGKSGYVSVKNTTPIKVEAHAVYKITLRVKASEINSGAFYIRLAETESIWANKNLDKNNTPLQSAYSKGFSDASVDSNNATNGYTDLTMYVSGRTFYDSEVELQLCLGKADELANGCVFVDSIKIDYATTADLANADVLKLQPEEESSESTAFENQTFDLAEVTNAQAIYPLSAQNNGWTLAQEENHSDKVTAGVVYLRDQQTYQNMYKTQVDGKLVYDWATSYPGNPDPKLGDIPNNVYMFHNGEYSYQSITSSSYTLNADSYYKLNFDYFNLDVDTAKDAQLTVEIVDKNGIVLFSDLIENSHNQWNTNKPVNINIHTPLATSHEISVVIHFGTKDNLMIGTSYVDNISLAASDEQTFASASQKVDLDDYMLNLDPDRAVGQGTDSKTAYIFSVDSGASNAARAEALDGESNQHNETFIDENGNKKNILTITSLLSPNTSSITSNFPFSLTSGKYYKLTFAYKTNIRRQPGVTDQTIADEKSTDGHECKYGITVGLTNYKSAENLLTKEEFADENGWTTYTIYYKATQTSESNFKFTLEMDKHYQGSAYITNISFVTLSADEYLLETENSAENKNMLVSEYVAETNDNSNTEIPDDSDSENGEFDSANWLVIPSLITALAVVIGLVGFALRHVKIKKIEKIKQETYDRKVSLNQDAILAAATKERDRQVAELKVNIDNMTQQKQMLEDEHKLAIKDARLSNKGKITKETEREFKTYASKLTRLEQKLDILNEQLAKLESQDYLIQLQRQFAADESKRQKEAIKKAKEEDKQKQSETKQK